MPDTTAPTEHDLMTPAEVRKALRIGQTTLSRWTRNGALVAVELPGGGRRYRRAEIKAILAGRTGSTPDAA